MGPDHPFNDFVRALAALIGACAWPIVALIVAFQQREAIKKLMERIEKIGNVDLQAKQQGPEGPVVVPPGAPTANSAIEHSSAGGRP
jgi:hypothetical protein